jgi:hypothetical protein
VQASDLGCPVAGAGDVGAATDLFLVVLEGSVSLSKMFCILLLFNFECCLPFICIWKKFVYFYKVIIGIST